MTKGYDGVKRWTKQVRAVVKSFICVCNTAAVVMQRFGLPKEGRKKEAKNDDDVLNVHSQVN